MWELMMKYSHDEADVTMVSHMLAATNALKKINRSKADDTTIFIFLVYWVYKKQIKPLVLLEKWNRTILNINETCKQLDATCLQILGIHVLSGSDTVSYHYGKCKMSAFTIITGTKKKPHIDHFFDLYSVHGEPNAKPCDLMKYQQRSLLLCGVSILRSLRKMPDINLSPRTRKVSK